MSRYQNTKSSPVSGKGFMKKDTTIYQNIPETNNDIFIITQYGDRLDTLAEQFYNDSSLWWFIGNTNGINTMNIEAGTRLRISSNTDLAKDIFDKSI